MIPGLRWEIQEKLPSSVIFGYLLKSLYGGGEGWIVSVDDVEDIIRGMYG